MRRGSARASAAARSCRLPSSRRSARAARRARDRCRFGHRPTCRAARPVPGRFHHSASVRRSRRPTCRAPARRTRPSSGLPHSAPPSSSGSTRHARRRATRSAVSTEIPANAIDTASSASGTSPLHDADPVEPTVEHPSTHRRHGRVGVDDDECGRVRRGHEPPQRTGPRREEVRFVGDEHGVARRVDGVEGVAELLDPCRTVQMHERAVVERTVRQPVDPPPRASVARHDDELPVGRADPRGELGDDGTGDRRRMVSGPVQRDRIARTDRQRRGDGGESGALLDALQQRAVERLSIGDLDRRRPSMDAGADDCGQDGLTVRRRGRARFDVGAVRESALPQPSAAGERLVEGVGHGAVQDVDGGRDGSSPTRRRPRRSHRSARRARREAGAVSDAS